MATYYWVGDNTAWDDVTTSNWATSTDGTPGAGIPTSNDDVRFDSTTKKVNGIAANVICNNLTATYDYMVAAGALNLYNDSYAVNVFGNFAVGSTISNVTLRPVTGFILMRSTSTGNFLSLGDNKPTSSLFINFDGVGGTWLISGTESNILNSNSYLYSMTVTNGTVSFNDTAPKIALINQNGGTIDWSGRTVSLQQFNRTAGTFSNASSSYMLFVDLNTYFVTSPDPINQSTVELQWYDSSSLLDTYPNMSWRVSPLGVAIYKFRLDLASSKYATSLDFNVSGGNKGRVAFITGNCSPTAKIGINGGGNMDMRSCVIDGSLGSISTYGFHVSSTTTCTAVETIINPDCVKGITLDTTSSYGFVKYSTSETSVKMPSDFNPNNNKIYLIGGGGGGSSAVNDNGGGGTTRTSGAGGGGGGITIVENFAGIGGTTYYYSIGNGGNGAGYPTSTTSSTGSPGSATTFNSGTYSAGGGGGGSTSLTESVGGAGGVGDTFSGGAGGAGIVYTSGIFDGIAAGGGGGGGAAGPGGNGGAGGDGNKTSTGVALGGAGGGAGTSFAAGFNAADASTTSAGVGGNAGDNTGGGLAGTSTDPIDNSSGTAGGGAGGPYGTNTSDTISRTALGGNYANSLFTISPVGGGGGSSSHGDNQSPGNPSSTKAGRFGGGGGGGSHGTSYGQKLTGVAGANGAIILTYVPTAVVTNAGGMFLLI